MEIKTYEEMYTGQTVTSRTKSMTVCIEEKKTV
jgi:hypothetical protein